MNTSLPLRWMGVLIYLMNLVGVSGQNSQSTMHLSPVLSFSSLTTSMSASPVSQEQAASQACQTTQPQATNLFQPDRTTPN